MSGREVKYAICGATKRSDGNPCKRPAGWGTPHPGSGKCKLHGGSVRSHVKKAKRESREAEARADVARFGARKDVHPAQALLELVQRTSSEVDYWRAELRRLEAEDLIWGRTKSKTGGDDAGETYEAKQHVVHQNLIDASNRLERYATSALRAGVEERQVRLAETAGAQLAEVLKAVLRRLELDERQASLVATVVPEELARLRELTA